MSPTTRPSAPPRPPRLPASSPVLCAGAVVRLAAAAAALLLLWSVILWALA